MIPLWIEYPDYAPHCLGWRMGDGEDYLDKWYKFINELTEEGKKEYFGKYDIPEGYMYLCK